MSVDKSILDNKNTGNLVYGIFFGLNTISKLIYDIPKSSINTNGGTQKGGITKNESYYFRFFNYLPLSEKTVRNYLEDNNYKYNLCKYRIVRREKVSNRNIYSLNYNYLFFLFLKVLREDIDYKLKNIKKFKKSNLNTIKKIKHEKRLIPEPELLDLKYMIYNLENVTRQLKLVFPKLKEMIDEDDDETRYLYYSAITLNNYEKREFEKCFIYHLFCRSIYNIEFSLRDVFIDVLSNFKHGVIYTACLNDFEFEDEKYNWVIHSERTNFVDEKEYYPNFMTLYNLLNNITKNTIT